MAGYGTARTFTGLPGGDWSLAERDFYPEVNRERRSHMKLFLFVDGTFFTCLAAYLVEDLQTRTQLKSKGRHFDESTLLAWQKRSPG